MDVIHHLSPTNLSIPLAPVTWNSDSWSVKKLTDTYECILSAFVHSSALSPISSLLTRYYPNMNYSIKPLLDLTSS